MKSLSLLGLVFPTGCAFASNPDLVLQIAHREAASVATAPSHWICAANLIPLVILAVFALVFHSISLEDRRKTKRRQANLPPPEERRINERRKRQLRTHLAWIVRTHRANLFRRFKQ